MREDAFRRTPLSHSTFSHVFSPSARLVSSSHRQRWRLMRQWRRRRQRLFHTRRQRRRYIERRRYGRRRLTIFYFSTLPIMEISELSPSSLSGTNATYVHDGVQQCDRSACETYNVRLDAAVSHGCGRRHSRRSRVGGRRRYRLCRRTRVAVAEVLLRQPISLIKRQCAMKRRAH